MAKDLLIELLASMFSHLPPWILPSASLVCKRWWAFAFPILYRTFFITSYLYTNRLVDRINRETPNSPLQICACTRSLVVDLEPNKFPLPPTEEDLDPEDEKDKDGYSYLCLPDIPLVEKTLLKLKLLESVCWISEWLLSHPATISDLARKSNVRTVHLRLEICHLTPHEARYIFALKNLTQLHLRLDRTVALYEEEDEDENLNLTHYLIQMLHASPNLEVLSLSLWNPDDTYEPKPRWNSNVVFMSLATSRYPHLQVFRVHSDWLSPHPSIKIFFRKYLSLHTVELSCNDDVSQPF